MKEILYKLSHIVAGLLTALSLIISVSLPIVGFLIFLVYEGDEYKVLGDALFDEMLEYGIGFFTGITILIMTKLFIIG